MSFLFFSILGCRQDATMKISRIQELEKAISEQQRELDHRQEQSKDYETKLLKLQEQARIESEQGEKLDQTLEECQREMTTLIEQQDEMKEHHKNEMKDKMNEVLLPVTIIS